MHLLDKGRLANSSSRLTLVACEDDEDLAVAQTTRGPYSRGQYSSAAATQYRATWPEY